MRLLADAWSMAHVVEVLVLKSLLVVVILVARLWCLLFLGRLLSTQAGALWNKTKKTSFRKASERIDATLKPQFSILTRRGPPSDDFGRINQMYVDLDTRLWYGPKLASGWGPPQPNESMGPEKLWELHLQLAQQPES